MDVRSITPPIQPIPLTICEVNCRNTVTIVDNGQFATAACEITTSFRSTAFTEAPAPRSLNVTVGCVAEQDLDFNFVDGSLPGVAVDAGDGATTFRFTDADPDGM